MTTHWFGSPFTGASDTGQPGTGPTVAERILLLQRVRDGLLREPVKSSSDGEDEAA